jgi:AraC family transcriptional regulator
MDGSTMKPQALMHSMDVPGAGHQTFLSQLLDHLASLDSTDERGGQEHSAAGDRKEAAAAIVIRGLGAALDLDDSSARDCAEHAIRLIQSRRSTASSAGGLAGWQAKRVIAFIEENLAGRIAISDLARIARVSRGHFARAFRKHFGRSPSEYVIERRVDQARTLMRTTAQGLCEIALDCGFADQAHMSRHFRRRTGFSPRAWRVTQTRLAA